MPGLVPGIFFRVPPGGAENIAIILPSFTTN